jgi:CheY-like chemotaxis protein
VSQVLSKDKQIILFVDDERELVEVLDEAVSAAFPQCEFVGFSTVDEARRFVDGVANERFAVVMVDHRMGADTGLEIAELLRKRGVTAPMMMLTGQAPPDVEARATAQQVRVVWKPARLALVVSELRDMMGLN